MLGIILCVCVGREEYNFVCMYFLRILMAAMVDNNSTRRTSVGSVYHRLEDVLNVLQKPEFCSIPEVRQLVSIFHSEHEQHKTASQSAWSKTGKTFPFIVLEGLDGSGKTTMTKKLSNSLSGVRRRTPPECLLGLRAKFDMHPIELRRAYYSLGNYIAAYEVEVLRCHYPVVMDRFWHSTAAYAIASEVHEGGGKLDLPPEGDSVYDWPPDLLKPDIVLFLYVCEEVLKKRLSYRVASTLEEDQLKDDVVFRSNLMQAYKRMRNPGTVKINSNKITKNVLAEVNSMIEHLTDKSAAGGIGTC